MKTGHNLVVVTKYKGFQIWSNIL